MRTKRFFALVLLFLMLFTLFSGCAQAKEEQLEPPEWMKEHFKQNNKNEPYARGVPLHEMDFSEYWRYFEKIGDDLMIHNEPETVVLPCDVEYYRRKGDKKPALVIPKGTEVYIRKNNLPQEQQNRFFMSGYGVETWPDYEADWRYGIPFRTELDYVESLVGAKRYYVKTQQLFQVADAYFALLDEKNPLDESAFEGEPEQLEYAKSMRERRSMEIVLSIDSFLVYRGAFLSLDYIKYYELPPKNPNAL